MGVQEGTITSEISAPNGHFWKSSNSNRLNKSNKLQLIQVVYLSSDQTKSTFC